MLGTLICPGCGSATESTDAKNCSYCKSAFILKSSNDLLGKTDKQLTNYENLYKKVTKEDPDYMEAQISLVALYLLRGLVLPAVHTTEILIKEFPDSGEVYLWRAISLIKRRGFRRLELSTAKKAVELIAVGKDIAEDPDDYLFVGYILQKKYFRRKCLKEPRELSEMLESIPKNIDAEEFIKEWSHDKEERGDLIHSKILLGDS